MSENWCVQPFQIVASFRLTLIPLLLSWLLAPFVLFWLVFCYVVWYHPLFPVAINESWVLHPLLAWYCQCSGVGHCNRYSGPYFNLHCLDDMAHLFTCCFPGKVSLMEHAFGNVFKNSLPYPTRYTGSLLCSSCFIFHCIYGPFSLCYVLVLTALTEKAVLVVLISSHFIFLWVLEKSLFYYNDLFVNCFISTTLQWVL